MSKDPNCQFCTPGADVPEVISNGRLWFVKNNLGPYKGVAPHLLVIPHDHIVSIQDLTAEMAVELIEIWQVTERQLQIPGGGFFNRFGDSKYHGGSQPHLHFHIMVPDGTAPVDDLFNKKRA